MILLKKTIVKLAACPECKEEAGHPCRTNHNNKRSHPHDARVKAAKKEVQNKIGKRRRR